MTKSNKSHSRNKRPGFSAICSLILICILVLCSMGCSEKSASDPVSSPETTSDSSASESSEASETIAAQETTAAPEPITTPEATATPEPTSTPEPTPADPTPTPDPDGPFFDPSTALDAKLGKWYGGVLNDARVSLGNGYRLAKKLEAAKAGEETTVLFIGGSVTEGALASERTPQGYQKGYAYITYEYLRDNYGAGDGSNVNYVNVGVSGTSSALGMVRFQKDVLDHNPDIVFIEFAVNNSTVDFDRKTFESMIRRLLKDDNEIAVVLLFSAATYAGATQNYMISYGLHYNLPMISMQNGLKWSQSVKAIQWSDFSSDSVHPGQDGHYLYAKAICKTLKQCVDQNTETEYIFPEDPYSETNDMFENMIMIDNTDENGFIKSTGCFTASRTPFSSTGGSDNHALENGWTKSSTSGAGTMKLSLKCRTFVIVPMQTNASQEASLDVYIDGEYVQSIVVSKSGAWRNPDPQLVLCSDKAEKHSIEIRTNASSENVQATILAMAYTVD